MVWQPARLTRAQLAERRLAAGRLLRAGKLSQAAIARQLGVSRAAVSHWRQRLAGAGWAGLQQHRASGRASRLRAAQWAQLLRLLARGAVAAGFPTARWTLRRISRVIAQTFGVPYHRCSLGRALRARGALRAGRALGAGCALGAGRPLLVPVERRLE